MLQRIQLRLQFLPMQAAKVEPFELGDLVFQVVHISGRVARERFKLAQGVLRLAPMGKCLFVFGSGLVV